MLRRWLAFSSFLLIAFGLYGQTDTGELRITVTDATQRAIQTNVVLVSEANQYRRTFQTDATGHLSVNRLPFGVYRVALDHPGFVSYSGLVEVQSALPKVLTLVLTVAPIATTVTVTDSQTLIDPNRVGTVNRIGSDTIAGRPASLPGRSIVDLVNSQPGWLYEGNA
ncbi:MAG TPA: carboxypeptidase-like regulatory domain-containing protein, partial [Bryobacteraceae bacterium]|nr:carboxypeptidase-like regulatory domain-containing protein [Bryobacteraceae bacterium]